MRIDKFNLQITVGRAINFQSCSASVSVDVQLEGDETVTQGIERYKGAMVGSMKKITKEEVLLLNDEKREIERQIQRM